MFPSLETSILSVVSLFIMMIFIRSKWISSYSNMKKNLPPSPFGLPIIGNLHQIGLTPHQSLRTLAHNYGSLMLIHLGTIPVIVASSAEAAQEIMKTHDLIFTNRLKLNVVNIVSFDGKIVSFSPYGENWRQSKSVQKMFSHFNTDPTIWEDADKFKPERFLDTNIDYKGLHIELLPFGAGRRGCPGIQFAMSVNMLALANLVYKFDFKLPNGLTLEQLDMTDSTGITVRRKLVGAGLHPNDFDGILSWHESAQLNTKEKLCFDVVINTSTWVIWRFRNRVCFDLKPSRRDTLIEEIKTLSRLGLLIEAKTSG
nr:cytochrome P450 [Tanacetum cinerariifolium]